jgi:hypothetical protein
LDMKGLYIASIVHFFLHPPSHFLKTSASGAMAAPNGEQTKGQVEGLSEEAQEILVGTILLEVATILTSIELGEDALGPAFPPRPGYGTRGTPVSLYTVRKPRKKKKKNKNKVVTEDASAKGPETKPPPPDGDGAGSTGGVTVFLLC